MKKIIKTMKKEKIKVFVIEPILDGEWDIVNMNVLMEDGTWGLGMNLITSLENMVELADKENVPIITRKYLETKPKKLN
jgi:hypothetical protein